MSLDNPQSAGTGDMSAGLTDEQDASRVADLAMTMLGRDEPPPRRKSQGQASTQDVSQDQTGDADIGDADPEPTEEEIAAAEAADDGQQPEGEAVDGDGEAEAEAEQQEDDGKDADAIDIAFEIVEDGKSRAITKAEAKQGYLRQADYSRKTAALASERKEVTTHRQQLVDAVQHYTERARAVDPIIRKGMETDWNKLAREDPGEYVARVQEFNARKAEIEKLEAEAIEEQKRLDVERFEREEKLLLEKRPDWGDKEKRLKIAKDIDAYLTKKGMDPKERALIADSRVMDILFDALDGLKYQDWKERISKGKQQLRQAAQTPPRASRPQARSNRVMLNGPQRALRERATTSGDPRAIADYFDATKR